MLVKESLCGIQAVSLAIMTGSSLSCWTYSSNAPGQEAGSIEFPPLLENGRTGTYFVEDYNNVGGSDAL